MTKIKNMTKKIKLLTKSSLKSQAKDMGTQKKIYSKRLLYLGKVKRYQKSREVKRLLFLSKVNRYLFLSKVNRNQKGGEVKKKRQNL